VLLDSCFVNLIFYKLDGKMVEEAVGWASQGMTEKKATAILAELHENHRRGTGPRTMKEQRELGAAERQEQEELDKQDAADNLTLSAIFYDKFNLSESKFIQGKILTFSFLGKKFYVHSTNLISGILFIIIGIVLLVYRGTSIINRLDIFGTKSYFYSIQRQLIEWKYANMLGIAAFFLFLIILGWFLWVHRYKK